jgi:AAA family ATP:ADP antiporter
LFLRTSRQAKYKAKFAIDSFFARAGDAMSAALVFAGTLFAFDIRSFALFNAASVVVWLVVAGAIVRARRREKTAALQPRVAA